MKYLILLGDGMADFPIPALNGKTPLQHAATPAMDEAVRRGFTGLLYPIPDTFPPGSDIGNLALFGYNPADCYTGRAPLEAAARGIALASGDVAFRCNLVTLADGAMASFTADHIPTQTAKPLIAYLSPALADAGCQLHSGVSYRHLAIINDSACSSQDLVDTRCTPPHDISDQPYEPHLPDGPAAGYLRSLMKQSQPLLAACPANAERTAQGHLPVTSIWLWGQGTAPAMPSYLDRFRLRGAVVSAVDLVHGIGASAGLEIIRVPGATGYLDTNYAGKVDAALHALETLDFAYLHVEAPDEAAHEGSPELKVRAIEDFDANVVAPCLRHLENHPSLRILIAPDHITSLASRTHERGPVPFAVCGSGIEPGSATRYSEADAEQTGIAVHEGHLLTQRWLTCGELTPEALISPAS